MSRCCSCELNLERNPGHQALVESYLKVMKPVSVLNRAITRGGKGGSDRESSRVKIDDVAELASTLAGVRHTVPRGRSEWRYHGRLVARVLDTSHIVIRAEFDYRDAILRQFPETFTVPTRYRKHMMV